MRRPATRSPWTVCRMSLRIWDGHHTQSNLAAPTGTVLSSFQDPTGKTVLYPQVAPANELVIYGDSISESIGATAIANGCFALIRQTPSQWNGRVSFLHRSLGAQPVH